MPGFIYIMSNPSFVSGRVKIGKSDRDPERYRKEELETTGVPEPFHVEYFALVEDHDSLERSLHKKFADYRVRLSREFFDVSIEIVVQEIHSITKVFYEKKNYNALALGRLADAGPKKGQVTVTMLNGDKYVGALRDGKFNGQGNYKCSNGDEYIGEFRDGKFHGLGTVIYTNGDSYVGEFSDGKYHGQGICKFANGNEYAGEFRDRMRNGQGAHTFPDGAKYVGEFRDNKYNGRGTLTYSNGETYEGEFREGKFEGQGSYTFTNGKRHVGKFREGIFVTG
jgi:hypothetical protein